MVECLSAMAVNGDESNVLEYTTKWIGIVNRGGLFEISDTTYMFFKEIELKVRRHLLIALERSSCLSCNHYIGKQLYVLCQVMNLCNFTGHYFLLIFTKSKGLRKELKKLHNESK